MASVSLNNVHKHYGKVIAVRGISMDIQDGEFMAFLGPSGCGKSSTMRMIAGLEEITDGDIRFNGASIITKKPSERNVAMAFETYALYPTLNVYENLAFPLRAMGTQQTEVDLRVREVAEIIGITPILNQKPRNLSSGQSQAVGLARALIRKPNVFLLDEPISHLDTSQRFRMRLYLKRLHIELGYTMVLVTHDQEDAMALADRVAVMNDGLLYQVDTPRQIYDHPGDLFVAGFIGDLPMNFIDGKPVSENGRMFLQCKSLRINLPAQFNIRTDLPEEIVLGFRPYHAYIDQDDKNTNQLAGHIFIVETLGELNVATVQLDETRIQVVMPTTYKAASHTPVQVTLEQDSIHLFDKNTGKSIG